MLSQGVRNLRGVFERISSEMARRRAFPADCGDLGGAWPRRAWPDGAGMAGSASRWGVRLYVWFESHSTPAPQRGPARPSGTLYVSSTQVEPRTVTIIDAATGRLEVHRVRELSPGDPPYAIAIVAGRLVVYGRLATYSFDARMREPSRRIGASWFFLPSATPGSIWLASLNARDRNQTHGLGNVREVTD